MNLRNVGRNFPTLLLPALVLCLALYLPRHGRSESVPASDSSSALQDALSFLQRMEAGVPEATEWRNDEKCAAALGRLLASNAIPEATLVKIARNRALRDTMPQLFLDLDCLKEVPGFDKLVQALSGSNNPGPAFEARVGAIYVEEVERISAWRAGHEVDVVLKDGTLVEVKSGRQGKIRRQVLAYDGLSPRSIRIVFGNPTTAGDFLVSLPRLSGRIDSPLEVAFLPRGGGNTVVLWKSGERGGEAGARSLSAAIEIAGRAGSQVAPTPSSRKEKALARRLVLMSHGISLPDVCKHTVARVLDMVYASSNNLRVTHEYLSSVGVIGRLKGLGFDSGRGREVGPLGNAIKEPLPDWSVEANPAKDGIFVDGRFVGAPVGPVDVRTLYHRTKDTESARRISTGGFAISNVPNEGGKGVYTTTDPARYAFAGDVLLKVEVSPGSRMADMSRESTRDFFLRWLSSKGMSEGHPDVLDRFCREFGIDVLKKDSSDYVVKSSRAISSVQPASGGLFGAKWGGSGLFEEPDSKEGILDRLDDVRKGSEVRRTSRKIPKK